MATETSRIGKRGTFVIPAKLRRRFGIQEGSEVIVEETPDGILIRPAMTVPIEVYSADRRAEFLLSDHLITGDHREFGPFFGRELGRVIVRPRGDYRRQRKAQ